MNEYPQQYMVYYPASYYQPMFFEELVPVVVGIGIMIAIGAWALSLVKKAIKGEEVGFPL